MAGLNSLMLANCLFFVDVQEVRSSVLSQSLVLKILKYFEPCFITNVRKQFCFWWCSWGSKFCFRPKWDVRMCSKSNPLKFEVFEVRFFDVRSTSRMYKKWKNHSLCVHSAHSGWRSAYFLNTIVSSHSALNKREARDKNKKYMHNSHLSLSVLLKRLKSTFFSKRNSNL